MCQDLKDYMRQAGEVVYADAHRIRPNEGFVQTLLLITAVQSSVHAPAAVFPAAGIKASLRTKKNGKTGQFLLCLLLCSVTKY